MSIKVGTVCVGIHHRTITKYNGMECTVTGALAKRKVRSSVTGEIGEIMCYVVEWANGDRLASRPENIKPKRDPDADMSWARDKVRSIINKQPETIS